MVAITGILNRPDPTPVSVVTPGQERPVTGVPVTVEPQTPIAAPTSADPMDLDPIGTVLSPAVPATAGTATAIGAEPEPVILPLDALEPSGVSATPAPPPVAPRPLEDLFAEVESALIAEDLDAAATLLAEIAMIEPGSSRLTFLEAQLERERARLVSGEAIAAAEAQGAGTPAPPSELTSLIGLARARLAQGQLASPAGDSALDYFSRASGIDPGNTALAPLARELGAAVLGAADIELGLGRLAEAEALISRAQGLGVSDEDLVGLELGLIYARETRTRATQDSLIATAAQRREQGRLFAPEADSALAALLEARQLDPNYEALAPALAALARELQDAAETALAALDWDRAAAAINGLTRSGAALDLVGSLRDALSFGQTQEAYLAVTGPASELNVIQFEPPVYPARAVARGTEGWVDLEFIVDTQGLPRDILVTAAEPPGEFDTAALAAAATYVYQPFERDGRTYERRVTLRMRFALE
jgi:protein TonB